MSLQKAVKKLADKNEKSFAGQVRAILEEYVKTREGKS